MQLSTLYVKKVSTKSITNTEAFKQVFIAESEILNECKFNQNLRTIIVWPTSEYISPPNHKSMSASILRTKWFDGTSLSVIISSGSR